MPFLLFAAAVIGLGVFTIKLKRRNRERFLKAFDELLNSADNSGAASDTEPVTSRDDPQSVRGDSCR